MKKKAEGGVVNVFKLILVFFLLFICIAQIFVVTYFSYQFSQSITMDKIIMGGALILLTLYIMSQELMSQKVLRKSYDKLEAIQDKIKETNLDTIRTLILAEEAKDQYTSGHSGRVSKYSRMVAEKLGFSEEKLRVLENASILHDVGKLGISNSILQKKGKLNADEWKIIKKHPKLGVDIISPLAFLSKEKDIIKHHHERYDGRGYPDGLKGEEIPLGSRILTATDAFDAMKSTRPYRPPLKREDIISEFKTNAGTQFDPRIVDVLLELLKENKDDIWEE